MELIYSSFICTVVPVAFCRCSQIFLWKLSTLFQDLSGLISCMLKSNPVKNSNLKQEWQEELPWEGSTGWKLNFPSFCSHSTVRVWGRSREQAVQREWEGLWFSPDGHLQPGGRTSGPIPEKPGPPQVTSCCLLQGPGRKSFFVQVWAFGKKPCSQASVLWVVEQLVKLFGERPDHKPAPLSGERVS